MVSIIIQHEDIREGNDCTINDAIILLSVHGKYVVEVIRRYRGFADNGLDFRSRKEFDDAGDAYNYYLYLVNNRANR